MSSKTTSRPICLFTSSVTFHTVDEETSKNTDIFVTISYSTFVFPLVLPLPLLFLSNMTRLSCSTPSFHGGMRKLGKHVLEYVRDVYTPKREVVSSWPLPADDVAAPSAVLGVHR